MAITYADLVSPTGPVEYELFALESEAQVQTRLNDYCTQAIAKNASIDFANANDANIAWALHLTFRAAHIVAVARPSTDNAQVAVLGSQAYDKDQRDILLELAEDYLSEYNVMLSAVPTEESPKGVPTRSTTNVFDY